MDAQHLDRVVAQVPDFGSWSHSRKVQFFGWYSLKTTGRDRFDQGDVRVGYSESQLKPSSNLPTDLARLVARGDVLKDGRGLFLERSVRDRLDNEYGPLLAAGVPSIPERAEIRMTPLMSHEEIADAKRMAELFLVIHCFENSVRKLVASTLAKALGAEWWNQASNKEMARKVVDRQSKEKNNRWLTPRGDSPLYYVDWGDLVALIRKHEGLFQKHIGSLKFAELRLEEMESLRNIIAHNGVLTSEDDFTRVVLHFKDWCRQIV